jgi:hypothetical protein
MPQNEANALNTQVAPFPEELAHLVSGLIYRPGWSISLENLDRGQGSVGLTLVITTMGYNSYYIDRGETYRVHHYMIVPAAGYDQRSWRYWLFEQLALVERHECAEFFQINGERPYSPNHGPGRDPYQTLELGSQTDAATSFRGVVNA